MALLPILIDRSGPLGFCKSLSGAYAGRRLSDGVCFSVSYPLI